MIDIMALVATLAKIATTVSGVRQVVQEAVEKNRDVRKDKVPDLAEQLKYLSEQLSSVSEMGKILDSYIRFRIQALRAYGACGKLLDFIYDNKESLTNKDDPSHKDHWSHVRDLVERVQEVNASNNNVILGRSEFFGKDDEVAIRMWVDQFRKNYERTEAYRSSKAPLSMIQHVEEMQDISLKMGQMFEDSIFNKMIRSLIKIGG